MRDSTDLLTGELMLLLPGDKTGSGQVRPRRSKPMPDAQAELHELKLAAVRAKRYRRRRKAAALAVLDNLDQASDVLVLDQLRLAVAERRAHVVQRLAQELIDRFTRSKEGGSDSDDD